MKRKFTFFLILSAAILFCGCQKAQNVFPEPTDEPPTLTVRTTIGLENTAGSVNVDVATNSADWTAKVEGELPWIKLIPTAGTPGVLTIEVAENDIMDERTADVVITAAAGQLTQTLRVVQFGTAKKIIFTQGARQTVDGAGETFQLEVLTNCPTFDWEIDPEADWITDVTPVTFGTKAFEEYSSARTFSVPINPLEAARTSFIKVVGTGLGLGASATIIIEQSPNVVMQDIAAKFISYSGANAATMDKMFDGLFNTFGETNYSATGGADKTTLEMDVKADRLFQIKFYPRNYDPTTTPIKLGSVNQYPADMELWVKKAGKDWEKVQDVQIRGTGTQNAAKKYPNLAANEVPYYIYDGEALADVRSVRLVITSGNSLTGENNQFWNASEIQFAGIPATVSDPVQVPIAKVDYSWVSSDVGMPSGDGGALTLLVNGVKTAADYWQTPYGAVTAEEAAEKGKVGSTEDAVANGTTLTLTLDKAYDNFSELRYYIRNSKTQVPKVFEIWVDAKGNGRYELAKSFDATSNLVWEALPGFTAFKLDAPVPAKAVQIYVKETAATDNAMFMCASEIEAYILP